MQYRRKPVVRDVVDALHICNEYVVLRADGVAQKIPESDFERDYEPVKRERTPKPRKPRKAKDGIELEKAAT